MALFTDRLCVRARALSRLLLSSSTKNEPIECKRRLAERTPRFPARFRHYHRESSLLSRIVEKKKIQSHGKQLRTLKFDISRVSPSRERHFQLSLRLDGARGAPTNREIPHRIRDLVATGHGGD